MTSRTIGLAVACSAALAFVACSGGGGGDAVDPEEWVADLCDVAIDYEAKSNELGEEFDQIDLDDADAKDEVIDLFEELAGQGEDLQGEVEDLGRPDLDDGEEIREATLDNLETSRDNVRDTIEALRDVDEDDFATEFQAILADVDDPDLKEAFEDIGSDGDEIVELVEENEECEPILFDN